MSPRDFAELDALADGVRDQGQMVLFWRWVTIAVVLVLGATAIPPVLPLIGMGLALWSGDRS